MPKDIPKIKVTWHLVLFWFFPRGLMQDPRRSDWPLTVNKEAKKWTLYLEEVAHRLQIICRSSCPLNTFLKWYLSVRLLCHIQKQNIFQCYCSRAWNAQVGTEAHYHWKHWRGEGRLPVWHGALWKANKSRLGIPQRHDIDFNEFPAVYKPPPRSLSSSLLSTHCCDRPAPILLQPEFCMLLPQSVEDTEFVRSCLHAESCTRSPKPS